MIAQRFHIKRVTLTALIAAVFAAGTALAAPPPDQAPAKGKVTVVSKATVSVLNMWTSGSEAKSMGVLQEMLAKQGYKMLNDAVAGGGGDNEYTVLKSRVQSGDIPGFAQMKAPQVASWCKTGLTMSLEAVAKQQHWNTDLPADIAAGNKCDGHFVAAPFDIHRLNWLWINRADLQKAGVAIPTDWNSFVAALKKLKAAGIQPIAGGGNTWQTSIEMGAIAISTGGPEFYRKAFVDLNPQTLSGPMMAKVFKRLRILQSFENPLDKGLTWNHNSGEVADGKAAMQIMGDWAKGEFANDGVTPGKEIACIPFPGKYTGFVYTVDSFLMFAHSKSSKAAQYAFARTAMSPSFQRRFNMVKGSIPVSDKVSLAGFDACAVKSHEDLKEAEKHHAVLPSYAVDQAQTPAIIGAMTDVIARFTNDKSMSPATAAKQLANAVKQAKAMLNL